MKYVSHSAVCYVLTAGLWILSGSSSPAAEPLNANDISFLWPVPQTAADVAKLISVDEKGISGPAEIWPPKAFQEVTAAATTLKISFSPADQIGIRIPAGEGIETLSSWKVAGIRIDPSAPGCDVRLISKLGSTPQIRLVVQPVVVKNGRVVVHDFAAHLAFDFVTQATALGAGGVPIPAVADKATFEQITADLAALKAELKSKGVTTDNKIGVHPGFTNPAVDLPKLLRGFLAKYLRPERLNNIAFMGVSRPEPWVFFITRKVGDRFEVLPQRTTGGLPAIMFFPRDPGMVFPEPIPLTFGKVNDKPVGVSTTALLRDASDLEKNAFEAAPPGLPFKPKMKEIPDIIANPAISNVLNTDCVSCHTESSLRIDHSLPPAREPFVFKKPAAFGGIQENAVTNDKWNIRNFGWGVGFSGVQATVSMRTANEAAESAEFMNAGPHPEAVIAPPPAPVANALTLIVKAKDAENFAALKGLIAGMQKLPPDKNPIVLAMNRLRNVHYARFVFLEQEQKLMIITTYDNDFDAYIDLFVDEIGDVFNAILKHVDEAPVGRVQDNREAFRKFVHDHDVPATGGQFSAYPTLSVEAIKRLQEKQATPK